MDTPRPRRARRDRDASNDEWQRVIAHHTNNVVGLVQEDFKQRPSRRICSISNSSSSTGRALYLATLDDDLIFCPIVLRCRLHGNRRQRRSNGHAFPLFTTSSPPTNTRFPVSWMVSQGALLCVDETRQRSIRVVKQN
jgi:hypothetical protein